MCIYITVDIKFLFSFPIEIDVISHAPHIKRNYFPCSKKKELLKVKVTMYMFQTKSVFGPYMYGPDQIRIDH